MGLGCAALAQGLNAALRDYRRHRTDRLPISVRDNDRPLKSGSWSLAVFDADWPSEHPIKSEPTLEWEIISDASV